MSAQEPQIKTVMAFPNGNMVVLDQYGNQLPELQVNLFGLWAAYAAQRGYDPAGIVITENRGQWRVLPAEKDGTFHVRQKDAL